LNERLTQVVETHNLLGKFRLALEGENGLGLEREKVSVWRG
jgi:hypothetical protein